MASEHKLIVRTAAGVKVAEVSDYLWLSYTREVNEPGLLRFGLNGSHAAIGLLEDKGQVEVWRRNVEMGLDWTREMVALYRKQKRGFSDRVTFEATCQGLLVKLKWRHVLWFAGTANRSQFTDAKAETIMKTLVSYNAAASATVANGRQREGAIPGLTVEADGARGNTIASYGCAWANLLEALQELSAIGGGDFDLVKTGADAVEFRWYTGQLGTDRSDTVKFAVNLGNMARPEYLDDRLNEATVAIVGGQGEESEREVVVRTGPDFAASNDIEVFVNAAGLTTTSGLETNGDSALQERRRRTSFTFEPVQTPGTFYGVHYALGDLVSARYDDLAATFKVQAVTIAAQAGRNEDVGIELQAV